MDMERPVSETKEGITTPPPKKKHPSENGEATKITPSTVHQPWERMEEEEELLPEAYCDKLPAQFNYCFISISTQK